MPTPPADLNRRRLLLGSAGLGLLGLGGCATAGAAAGPVAGAPLASGQAAVPFGERYTPILPVHARMDRLFDITVCLRPFRAQGPRIEAEQVGDTLVVHNYGHGGSGWSLSWGSGTLAVRKAMANNPKEIAVVGCGAHRPDLGDPGAGSRRQGHRLRQGPAPRRPLGARHRQLDPGQPRRPDQRRGA